MDRWDTQENRFDWLQLMKPFHCEHDIVDNAILMATIGRNHSDSNKYFSFATFSTIETDLRERICWNRREFPTDQCHKKTNELDQDKESRRSNDKNKDENRPNRSLFFVDLN